jgi:hypothetical protein
MLLIFIEFTVPAIATVPLKVVVVISSALILSSSPILLQTIEVDKLITFTDTVISCSVTTTVYDAQVTNLNGGTVDEGISYRIITKLLPPLTEYCQVAPTSKPLTVIKPLLVIPSL